MSLPTDHKARKAIPMATGVLDYFPDALAEVAIVSKSGNDQHNPGQELHWAKEKSTDHADCIMRHLAERGTLDTDKMRHSAKLAWRALALLQTEIEAERAGMTVSQYVAKLKKQAASDSTKLEKQAASGSIEDRAWIPWIPWFGETNFGPAEHNKKVEIRFRDKGTCITVNAPGFIWKHTGSGNDIVAYRILEK